MINCDSKANHIYVRLPYSHVKNEIFDEPQFRSIHSFIKLYTWWLRCLLYQLWYCTKCKYNDLLTLVYTSLTKLWNAESVTRIQVVDEVVSVWFFQLLIFFKNKLYNRTLVTLTYIVTKRFGLIWFYGISPFVGYLFPNLVYTYIFKIYMICEHIL